MTGLHFLNDYTEINKMLYASIKSISTIHLEKWPAKNGEWRVVNRASAPEDRVWPDGLWPPYLNVLGESDLGCFEIVRHSQVTLLLQPVL